MKQTTQTIEAREVDTPRALGRTQGGAQLGDVPAVCLISDVCRILRFSRRTFYELMAKKKLALVEIHLDRTRRFTGESVERTRLMLRRNV